MNKENNRSAAGLRRSAIVERIRLREEWSELKGTCDQPVNSNSKQTVSSILKKRNINKNTSTNQQNPALRIHLAKRNVKEKEFSKAMQTNIEVLHGIVALVEVGLETRALALRAALTALGATVVPTWSPLVTHLVWAQGGCRATRARARALACRLVSPLWVEACAAAARRLPEQAFPAAARASDLPSPRTLRQMLKKAEMENIPLVDLLTDKDDDKEQKQARLRLSSETENDTSRDTSRDNTTDTSRDTTADTSRDKTTDKSRDTTDVESRVNTAPRRALPNSSVTSPKPAKSKRKLFTQREAEITKDSADDEEDPTPTGPKRTKAAKVTHRERKDLARAERMARRLVAACASTPARTQTKVTVASLRPRIVLTGMNRTERHAICNAIRQLNGRIQTQVNRRTTHVLLGTCHHSNEDRNCSGVTALNNTQDSNDVNQNVISNSVMNSAKVTNMCSVKKPRTLNALLGAARGCRVLHAQWAIDSLAAKQWLHHNGYEVQHLKKISQKARVERTALGKLHSEYAYDVFNGMRVRITPAAEQKDAAIQLLTLCGAIVQDGGLTQNGGQDFDIIIGSDGGEISSKWVFDSVAAGRMRTARRYTNAVQRTRDVPSQESVI